MSVDPLIANAIREALSEPIDNVISNSSPDRVSVTFGLCKIAEAIHHLARAIEGRS